MIAHAQDNPHYLRDGRVSYEGRTLHRPSEIEMALVDMSPEATVPFRTYRTLRGIGTTLGYVGSAGLSYGLSSLLIRGLNVGAATGPGVPIMVGGLGLMGAALALNLRANRALRQTIDIYNQQPTPPVSFAPLVWWQNGHTAVGIVVRF